MGPSKIKAIDPHFSENSYLINRELLKNFDPREMSAKSHCPYDPETGVFEIEVLGETYHVHYPGGEVDNAEGEAFDNYSVKIIMLRYLMNAVQAKQTDEYLSYKEFPDGPLYYPNFYQRCLQVFANIGNEKPEVLKQYMETLKAVSLEKGDCSWQLTVMPGVKLAFIFWFGDEEFEPEAQILFEKSLTQVFNIKDLAILGDVFIISLKTFAFALKI